MAITETVAVTLCATVTTAPYENIKIEIKRGRSGIPEGNGSSVQGELLAIVKDAVESEAARIKTEYKLKKEGGHG